MKQVVEIKAENVIGKKIKDVTLVFENGRIIESGVRVEDGSYLRIDPLKDKELFVMEFPSGKTEWLPIGENDIAQAPPAQDNQEAEKMGAGGCLPRPCSAPVELVLEGVCANCQCRTEFKTRVTINSSWEGIDSRWFIR